MCHTINARGKGVSIKIVNENCRGSIVMEEVGLIRFSAHMDVPSATHQEVMKSIVIFGNKIAPKVREALK